MPAFLLILSNISTFLGTRIFTSPDFSQAVGFSAFVGRPKVDEVVVLYSCVLSLILIAASFFIVGKRLANQIELPRMDLPGRALKNYQIMLLGILLSGMVVMNFPALDANFKSLATWSHSSNWGAQSLTTWQYAAKRR